MDWDKAKNITIIFMLALDICLGVLVYANTHRYGISAEQIKAIQNVLAQNNIHCSDEMIPRSFDPIRQLAMSPYDYNTEELLQLFFGSTEAEPRHEPDKMVFYMGDQTLTVKNGYITFVNPGGTDPSELTRTAAVQTSDELLQIMGDELSKFQFDEIHQESDGYRIKYCQVYKQNTIETNFVSFLMTAKGVTQIECQYSKPIGFEGEAIQIRSPDEALLDFTERYNSDYKDREANITRIDMVYSQTKVSPLVALPKYRVFVEGLEDCYWIDACIAAN